MTRLRSIRNATEPPELGVALAEVDRARVKCERLRRLVGERKAGASSLSIAEWELDQALRAVDRIRSRQDFEPDAA